MFDYDDFYDYDDYAFEDTLALPAPSNSADPAEKKTLKDTINGLKDRLLKWINGILSKFSRKEKAEKDPKKKGIFHNLISKIKGFFSKAKSADTVDELENVKQDVQVTITDANGKIEKISADVVNPDGSAAESFVGISDAYLYSIDAVFEAFYDDLYDCDYAMEGLFSKPKTAEQMIEKVRKNVNKKCKTVEDCDDMLANLTTEEEKFNSALSEMKNAAIQFRDGEIDKKQFKGIIKPAVKNLKKTCNIISLNDINDKTDNVTDEEIQKLHDFLTGARQVIEERKSMLSKGVNESMAYYDDFDYDDYAMEGERWDRFKSSAKSLGKKVNNATFSAVLGLSTALDLNPHETKAYRERTSAAKKAIDAKIREARKEIKQGNSARAISLLKEAKKGYGSILSAIKKLPEVESYGMAPNKSKVRGYSKANALQWVSNEMLKIDNMIDAINDRDADIADRAARRADRAARRQARKDDRAARRAAKRAAKESYGFDDAMYDLDMAIEGLMYGFDDDDYDDYAYESDYGYDYDDYDDYAYESDYDYDDFDDYDYED